MPAAAPIAPAMNTGLRPIRSASRAASGIASSATALTTTGTSSIVERFSPTTEVAKETDQTVKTMLTVLTMAARATRATAALW